VGGEITVVGVPTVGADQSAVIGREQDVQPHPPPARRDAEAGGVRRGGDPEPGPFVGAAPAGLIDVDDRGGWEGGVDGRIDRCQCGADALRAGDDTAQPDRQVATSASRSAMAR
jgi:hypothetical protein